MPPLVYRITPYDPTDRNRHGRPRELRGAFPDLDAAVTACLGALDEFLRDVGADELTIDNPMLDGFAYFHPHSGTEDHGLAGLFPDDHCGYHDGARVHRAVATGLVRTMLRRIGAWCRLHTDDGFFVHVGPDLDMYIGSDRRCNAAVARARRLGVRVSHADRSPYDPALDHADEQPAADDAFWARLTRLADERAGVLLEECYVRNASRWHRLTSTNVETVRAKLSPRARLAAWPDLTEETGAARAGPSRPGRLELLVVQQRSGRVFTRIAEPWMFTPDNRVRTYVHGDLVTVVPLLPAERHPLLAAVLPDADGVVRARWRTNPTRADERRAYLRTLRRGQIRAGVVAATPRFGVFVELEGSRGEPTGFINIPELTWEHIDHPSQAVQVDQQIRVEVLGVDLEREQVALSLKALQPDPWQLWADTVRTGQVLPGTVTKLVPFGVFVRVARGIEGPVPVNELAAHDVASPEDIVRPGDEVLVRITEIDLRHRRVSLSLRQAAASCRPGSSPTSRSDPARPDTG